jgi:hypothetical protein
MRDAQQNRQLTVAPAKAVTGPTLEVRDPATPVAPKDMSPWEKDRFRAKQAGILCTARGCGGKMSRVVDTKATDGKIIRMRVCALCGTKGKTVEA